MASAFTKLVTYRRVETSISVLMGQRQVLWERKMGGTLRTEKWALKLDWNSWEHFSGKVALELYPVENV